MRKQGALGGLSACGCEDRDLADFKVKNLVVPELAIIHEKLQLIKAMYC